MALSGAAAPVGERGGILGGSSDSTLPGLSPRYTLPVFLIKYYDNLKIIPCHAIL